MATEHTEDRDVELIEFDLLLQAIQRHYGYDFHNYARAPLRRRLNHIVRVEGLSSLSALQERVLHDEEAMKVVLTDLSISVTAMFRDPTFYRSLREKVLPLLRTYPFIRIWNAGCSTGEEAYSIAITLMEEGLYDRTRIYATDMNEAMLERAQRGHVSLDKLQLYTRNYIESGGKGAFSDYYRTNGSGGRFINGLSDNILFAQHNLVSDGSFNDFQLILCRNVLIYFDRHLQDQVHELLYNSLTRFGILALGQRESIRFTKHEARYQEIDGRRRIYRRVN